MGFNSGFKGLITFVNEMSITKQLLELFCVPSVFRDKGVAFMFVNNQLDAQFFFMFVYFHYLHVSDSHVPIIRRINCIYTISVTLYR